MINMVVRLVMSEGCEKLYMLDSDFFLNQFFQVLRVFLQGIRAENLDSDRK